MELNVQSYAAVFECLGRINSDNSHLEQIRTYTDQTSKIGITFDDVMNKAVFINDQRSHVLKAMEAYNSQYRPLFWPPKVHYDNHLVNHLNGKEQRKPPEQPVSVENEGLFSGDLLQQRINQQMELEKQCHITVSIF